MTSIQDPAIRSYFFGKGYTDLGAVIADTWRRNVASIRHQLSSARSAWPRSWAGKGAALVRTAAALSVLTFGTAFFLLASVFHVLALLTLFLVIYLCFTLIYLVERAYLTGKGFFPVCPSCHSKNPLAEYRCPNCNAAHRRLIPSSFGILHRTCKCGQELPTTFFLKRGQLPASCPDCNYDLAGLVEVRKIFVPVFGGPAVGKTAFLLAALRELVERWAPQRGFSVTFPDRRLEPGVRRAWEALDRGLPPSKTATHLPQALSVQLERSGQDKRTLYLYDPAGETFHGTEGLQLHKYQGYLSGLVFLIDPFSLQEVRAIYEDRLPNVEGALKPSEVPVEDTLARILIGLEEYFKLEKGARLKVPMAVVVNKIDAFGLEHRIGEPAVKARLDSLTAPTDPDAIRDQVIREQLVRWGLGGLVHQIETRFQRVGYFACSSLGRMPDASTRPFAGRGALDPWLWLLAEADTVFAAEKRRKAA